MSRIHEALKKAAGERQNQGQSGPASELLEIATPVPPLKAEAGAIATDPGDLMRQEWTDQRVVNYDDFVKQCAKPTWSMHATANVFSAQIQDQIAAERFRTLRSRLYQISATRPLKRIMMASSVPGEGKTFVAANLAHSFVRQATPRVLLIDGDLRASRLHLLLGAPEKPGLSDYLLGEAKATEVIQVGPQGNLCLIPGGKEVQNPSELLHSERMRHLLDNMSQLFDWIIVDSPPALAVHDASVIADMCDGVLLVVRAGSTDFEIAEKAAAEFRDRNLIGVVLNRVEKGDMYGEYYYGYSAERDVEGKVVKQN